MELANQEKYLCYGRVFKCKNSGLMVYMLVSYYTTKPDKKSSPIMEVCLVLNLWHSLKHWNNIAGQKPKQIKISK